MGLWSICGTFGTLALLCLALLSEDSYLLASENACITGQACTP
jgi:hypothetical protein